MKRSGGYVQQMRGYKAFIPKPLPPNPALKISALGQKHIEEAMASLARLDGLAYMLPNPDLFISMFVKKEAVLSSQIEGTQATLEDIFDYERGGVIENINDVEEVVNYVKALNYGIKRLKTLPMGVRLIKEMHAILLDGARGSVKTPGEFKRSQNWIGPAGGTLHDALFIPPPPEESLQAMSDFEKYMHKPAVYSELVNCALLHYQFETIHPFLDGNGRVGRLLITLYLHWKGIIEKPIFYPSYYLKKHRVEYYDRLMEVRNSGNYEQWVDFFIKALKEAADSAIESTKKILELHHHDQMKLWEYKISSPLATVLLDRLFYTPVITIADIEEHFKITHPTASSVIHKFVDAGILVEVTGQKRAKRFVYKKYLVILSEGTSILA